MSLIIIIKKQTSFPLLVPHQYWKARNKPNATKRTLDIIYHTCSNYFDSLITKARYICFYITLSKQLIKLHHMSLIKRNVILEITKKGIQNHE